MRKGFTLIEVLIASALFAMVALVGAATLASTYRVQNQVGINRSNQEAIRTSFELLTKEVRFSKNVQVNSSRNQLVVTETDDTTHTFFLSGGILLMHSGANDQAITGNTVIIDAFEVNGASDKSPFVKIDMKSHSKVDPNQSLESSIIVAPRNYE